MHDSPPVSKVYYRPIEAAIRWAGLLKRKKDMGLRIFRWTENMETAVPTDHPSDFLVYDADLLSWPVAF